MKGKTTWSQKRKIAPVAAAVGVALIAAACGSSSSASTTTQGGSAGTATNKTPIVVGLAAPLTGGNPSEGTSEQTIAKDAVAAINKAGGINGRPLSLLVRDTGGVSPTGAVSAFESLSSSGAAVVIGEWTSTNFQAACTVAMAERVVLIAHASATDGLTNGMTYCFRDEYQVAQSTGAMFGVAKANGWTKIAIAADSTSFGAAEADSWASLAGSYGASIVANVNWSSPATDLTAQVAKIASSGAQAVFVGSGSGPDVTLLAKTMAQMNVKLPIFGPGGINAPGVAAAAASAYNTLPEVLNITSYDSSVPKEKAFMSKISAETGITQGGGNPTRLWDAFQIAAAGLRASKGQGGTALVNALQGLGKFPTLAGGPGSYVEYTPTQHSGLFGPQMLSVYKWNKSSSSFAYDASLSKLADSSPGVNN